MTSPDFCGIRHGTSGGYEACRRRPRGACEACRRARTAKLARLRETPAEWIPPLPVIKPRPVREPHPPETRPCDRYGIPQSDRALAYLPLDHAARGAASDLVHVAFPAWAPLTPCRT